MLDGGAQLTKQTNYKIQTMLLTLFTIRVEYDDGDMGWVPDLTDGSKVKFVDDTASDPPPLMMPVRTPADVHAAGIKVEEGAASEVHASKSRHRDRSASFSDAAPDVVPREADV
jgi:hypothetical protein